VSVLVRSEWPPQVPQFGSKGYSKVPCAGARGRRQGSLWAGRGSPRRAQLVQSNISAPRRAPASQLGRMSGSGPALPPLLLMATLFFDSHLFLPARRHVTRQRKRLWILMWAPPMNCHCVCDSAERLNFVRHRFEAPFKTAFDFRWKKVFHSTADNTVLPTPVFFLNKVNLLTCKDSPYFWIAHTLNLRISENSLILRDSYWFRVQLKRDLEF